MKPKQHQSSIPIRSLIHNYLPTCNTSITPVFELLQPLHLNILGLVALGPGRHNYAVVCELLRDTLGDFVAIVNMRTGSELDIGILLRLRLSIDVPCGVGIAAERPMERENSARNVFTKCILIFDALMSEGLRERWYVCPKRQTVVG